MPQQTISYRAFWRPAGSWVPFPGLRSFRVRVETAQGTNGLGWGTDVTATATILATDATYNAAWEFIPVYGEIQKDGGPWVRAFMGILVDQDDDGRSLQYTAQGYKHLIERRPVRMRVSYRRPIATLTSATSIEDPSNPSYQGGLANEVFWQTGGRPAEQLASYPTASYYYRCDANGVCPEWPWIDATNAWDELLNLAEAGGGQVYQDGNGIMQYVSPLKLAEATGGTVPHFTNSVYNRLVVRKQTGDTFNVARANFVKRARDQQQEVVKDTTPRAIAASGSITVDLPIQWPIVRYDAIVVTAARGSGQPITPTVTVLSETAQQLTIQITNPLAERIRISQITVQGDPIVAAGEGVVVIAGPTWTATGQSIELRLNESDYIQTADDAERRCRMALAFYGVPRPTYTAQRCPYDPSWFVGQYCLVSNTRRGLASVPARIVSIEIEESGRKCNVGLVLLQGVPKLSDFFVVGQSYPTGTQKRVGW